jgi:pyruvate/2-oxoglutarate/acetoin dehydrogenase E1 component
LLQAAVQDWPYPTVFFEHKVAYGLTCQADGYQVSDADESDPAAALFPTLVKGAAAADVTIVTYGGMTPTVEAVVSRLEAEEVAVRTVIISLLAPLPRASLLRLVEPHCRRLAVVEEGHSAHGIGAELAAVLLESGYTGRFVRIGAPPVPLPAARSLESDVIPSEAFVFDEVASLFS